MSDPSSSSNDSSTELIDHLRFVLESSSSSDDSSNLDTILNNQSHMESLQLAMKHGQGGRPSSSRRPRKKKRFIRMDQEDAHDRLHRDYFADNLIHNETHFRRRFRMRKHLFLRIVDALSS